MLHAPPLPGDGIAGAVIAGELAVPEIESIQVNVAGILAPDDADIGDIEVVVPQAVQAVVAVMVAVGDDDAAKIVAKARLDPVLRAVAGNVERLLFHRRLPRLSLDPVFKRHRFRELVAVPAGHQ